MIGLKYRDVLTGDTVTVKRVKDKYAQVLNHTTGERAWVDLRDFAASHKPVHTVGVSNLREGVA